MWIVTAELDTLKIQNIEAQSPVEQIYAEFDDDEQCWFVEAMHFPQVVGTKLYIRRRRVGGPFFSEDAAFGFLRGIASSLVAGGLAAILTPPENT
jgi:hypothetical protein